MWNPDFRDLLVALSEEGVEFLLVGAYAVAAHGAPRSTGDMDVFIRASPENARKVWRALRLFGAPLADVTPEDFENPDLIYQIGIQPRRIDVITGISGVEFQEAWAGRQYFESDGLTVPVIGLRELLVNKRASGRHKDLEDVKTLEAIESSQAGPPKSSKVRPSRPARRPSRRSPSGRSSG